MNLKWTVKRFLLMSFSFSHLLLLEGESDNCASTKCYESLVIKFASHVFMCTYRDIYRSSKASGDSFMYY